jgi:beta-fructofuranosidase
MIGWLTEGRSAEAHAEAGWAGAMSLPRQIHIDADGSPRYTFVPELESLRKERISLPAQAILPGMQPLPLVSQQFELLMEIERGDAQRSGLTLLQSPDGALETRLTIDWQANTLTLERAQSGRDVRCDHDDLSAELPPQTDRLRLHLFVDGSTIECIVDQRVCLSGRVYPADPNAAGLALFSSGGSAKLIGLELYPLRSAW